MELTVLYMDSIIISTDHGLGSKKFMIIRKATGEEMLSLWGYEGMENASFTAKYFYQYIIFRFISY